jgi:hypothetical protein
MPVKNDREIQGERDVVRRLTAGAGAGADAPVESSAFARALNGTAEEGFRRFEVGVQDWFRRLVHQEPPVAPTVEAPEPSAQESSAAPELQA